MEKYKALKGRKVYLVFEYVRNGSWDIQNAAKQYFKASIRDIMFDIGYVYNDELYVENPHKKGAKKVIYAVQNRRRT